MRKAQPTVYDVIVVGARCAGAPTAMLFARAGYRTLLLERAKFPRDVLSTSYIHQPGVARLARWGILDDVIDGCPAITRLRGHIEDIEFGGTLPSFEGISAGYAPRRYNLDAALVRAAADAGAEFRDQCSVEDVLVEDGRVCGVQLTRGGADRAALVVGADGMRSRIADRVAAATPVADPTMTCAYYTFWPTTASDTVEFFHKPGVAVSVIPTSDGASIVAVYWPHREYMRVRQDANASYHAAVKQAAPALAERLAGARPLERLYGTGDQRNFFRTPAGRGWALVGDAGHHEDSIAARGITNAFQQAELLVECIAGTDPWDQDILATMLTRFAERRDAVLTKSYAMTLSATRPVTNLDQIHDFAEYIRRNASDPGWITRYLSSVSGLPEHQRPS
jgi:flavin-dependent dehydrogenase